MHLRMRVFACVCEEWAREACTRTPAHMQTSALGGASARMCECAQVAGAPRGVGGDVQAGFQLGQIQRTFI